MSYSNWQVQMRAMRKRCLIGLLVIIAMTQADVAYVFGIECEDFGPGTAPSNERVDIVFVIDGSYSMCSGCTDAFVLEKQAIKDALVGDQKVIEHDGTCAVAVIQFSTEPREEICLTVIDSETTATAVASRVDDIVYMNQGTEFAPALALAADVLEREAYGDDRHIVLSTDGAVDVFGDVEASLDWAQVIRNGTYTSPPAPTTICTSLLALGPRCYELAGMFEECFLRRLANTADSNDTDEEGWCVTPPPTQSGPAYPGAVDRALRVRH